MSTIFALTNADLAHWLGVLLDAAVKGLVILAIAFAATWLLRRRSAALRHAIWTLSVVALMCVPILSVALPQFQVPILPDWAEPVAPPSAPPTATAAPPQYLPAQAPVEMPALRSPEVGQEPAAVASPSPAEPVQPALASIDEAPRPPAQRPRHWSVWVLLAWAAGAAVMLTPLLVGTVTIWWRTRRVPRAAGPGWMVLLNSLRESLGLRRSVRLLKSTWSNIPLTCGVLRPVIVLPAEADDWSDQRRKVVLLHELAHVKRADCLTQLIARLARVLYWFNPLVWLAGRMLRIERERACDDLVLSAGHKASDYASHLLEIVRTLHSVRCPSMAAVAMARRSQFEGRMLAILDPRRNRRALTRISVLIAAILVAAIAVPMSVINCTGPDKPAAAPDEPATQPATQAAGAGDEEVRQLLADLARDDKRWAAVKRLGELGDARAVKPLCELLSTPGILVEDRKLVIAALEEIGHQDALPALTGVVRRPPWRVSRGEYPNPTVTSMARDVQEAAVKAMYELDRSQARQLLTELLLDHEKHGDGHSAFAARMLHKYGDRDDVPALVKVFDDRRPANTEAVGGAARALVRLDGQKALSVFVAELQRPQGDWGYAWIAAKGLMDLGNEEAAKALVASLKSDSPDTARAAARYVEEWSASLKKQSNEGPPEARQKAAAILKILESAPADAPKPAATQPAEGDEQAKARDRLAEQRLIELVGAAAPKGWEMPPGQQRGDVEPMQLGKGPGLELTWQRKGFKPLDWKIAAPGDGDILGGDVHLWIMDPAYEPKDRFAGVTPRPTTFGAASELGAWRGQRVFLWGGGHDWPTMKADILAALQATDNPAPATQPATQADHVSPGVATAPASRPAEAGRPPVRIVPQFRYHAKGLPDPTGRFAAARVTYRGTGLHIVDLKRERLAWVIEGWPQGHIGSCFSSDGRWLAICSPEGGELHDLVADEVRTAGWLKGVVPAFCPDDKLIYVAAGSEEARWPGRGYVDEVRVYDLDGKKVKTYPLQMNMVHRLSFSKDGQTLIVEGGTGVGLETRMGGTFTPSRQTIDLKTGESAKTDSPEAMKAPAFAGKIADGFDAMNSQEIPAPKMTLNQQFTGMVWDASTNSLAVIGRGQPEGGAIKLWNLKEGQFIATLGTSNNISSLAWQGPGLLVGTAYYDRKALPPELASLPALHPTSPNLVTLVQLPNGTTKPLAIPSHDWTQCQPSPDGRYLAGLVTRPIEGNRLQIWDVNRSAMVGEIKPKQPVFHFQWTSDGRSLMARGQGEDGRWELFTTSGNSVGVLPKEVPFGLVAFSPSGHKVAVQAKGPRTDAWTDTYRTSVRESFSGKEVATFEATKFAAQAIFLDEDRLLVASHAGPIRLIRISDQKVLWETKATGDTPNLSWKRDWANVVVHYGGYQGADVLSINDGQRMPAGADGPAWHNPTLLHGGRLALEPLCDSTVLRLKETATGRTVATFAAFADPEWIIYTPEGLWTGSPKALDWVAFYRGTEPLTAEEIAALRQPEAVKARLAGAFR